MDSVVCTEICNVSMSHCHLLLSAHMPSTLRHGAVLLMWKQTSGGDVHARAQSETIILFSQNTPNGFTSPVKYPLWAILQQGPGLLWHWRCRASVCGIKQVSGSVYFCYFKMIILWQLWGQMFEPRLSSDSQSCLSSPLTHHSCIIAVSTETSGLTCACSESCQCSWRHIGTRTKLLKMSVLFFYFISCVLPEQRRRRKTRAVSRL